VNVFAHLGVVGAEKLFFAIFARFSFAVSAVKGFAELAKSL
jgi:hypothetical protein